MAKEIKTNVIGIDEAGRGPLAGPVVACAVKIKSVDSVFGSFVLNIRDSKKNSPKKREYLYELLTNHPCIEWGIGIVSEKIIDQANILQATKFAMEKSLQKIELKNYRLIIDGNFGVNIDHEQKCIPKADENVVQCSMASIIAKVERDRIMQEYHKQYSVYGFDRHKGYGTKFHREMIEMHGACPIHRQTFKLMIK